MSLKVDITLTGGDDIIANFNLLTTAVNKKLNLHAVAAAMKPIEEAAIQYCPEGDDITRGLLKGSIDTKLSQAGPVCKAIMGPKRRVTMASHVRRRGKFKGQLLIKSPTRYARLVEFGAPNHNVKPQPFMRPAWDEEGGETALRRYVTDLKDGLAVEVSKLRTT